MASSRSRRIAASIQSEALLFSGGRLANTDELGLDAIGVALGRFGRPIVDDVFRTSVPHIFAAGDVIGFPALASTGMEQGRVAVAAAFRFETEHAGRADVVSLEATMPYARPALRHLHDPERIDGWRDRGAG